MEVTKDIQNLREVTLVQGQKIDTLIDKFKDFSFSALTQQLQDKDKADENRAEQNSLEHKNLKDGIDHTNGDVTSLKLWRARIVGGITVLTIFIGFMFTLYWNARADFVEGIEDLQIIKSKISISEDITK